MRIREYLGISPVWQARLTWFMEVWLVGIFFIGFYEGSVGVVVNAGVGILVTQLPPILRRDYDITLDPALTLWITSAVFLHALGTVGLPGGSQGFYHSLWWWDHLTHSLSSSIVAAAGYITARSFHEHAEGVVLPPKFMFAFILLFVLAFGVFWEVIEFALMELARVYGGQTILTQHGLDDTMLDLVFNTMGAAVVAIWGTAHLTDIVGAVDDYLRNSRSARGN